MRTAVIVVASGTRRRTSTLPSHHASPGREGCPLRSSGSNPGSGIDKTPANTQNNGWQRGPIADQSRKSGSRRVVARPGTGRYGDRLAPVGRSSDGTSQPRARARSAVAASSRRSPRELRASPAVPPALARRRSAGSGPSAPRCSALVGRRGSGGARRAAASHRRSGWGSPRATGSRSLAGVESALAPRTPSSARLRRCRRRAGGCGIRCRGRVGETSTRWRSRPTGIAVAIETKTRSYDQPPSRSGARAGGVAVTAPAKMGTQRRSWRPVPCPCAGRRTR